MFSQRKPRAPSLFPEDIQVHMQSALCSDPICTSWHQRSSHERNRATLGIHRDVARAGVHAKPGDSYTDINKAAHDALADTMICSQNGRECGGTIYNPA